MLYRSVGKKRLSFGARALIVAACIFVTGGAFALYAHWAVSAARLETNVRVEELSELKYYLVVKEDGVDKFGVQSTDDALAQIQSDTIEIRDRLPDGLEFLGFEPSPNGTLVAVERSNSNVTCRGAVVDDTQEANVDSGTWNDAHTEYYYHGLHYSEDTRTVTFSVKDLQAGCNLTVGISTRVPALNGASRMDFYNTAQTKEDDREEDSNTVHVWIGADETVTHRVSYNYTGDIPDSAPSLPRDANYSTGAPVSVALEPNLDGYSFSGWTSSDVTITNGSFSMPNGDVVLTGSFTRLPDVQKYEVSYAVTGDVPDDYIVPKTREYAPGETVTVDSTEAGTEIDHRIFSGWTTNDATITDGAFEMPDAPVVITGSFELQHFNLSYEFTGNELPENAAELLPAAQEYPYGAPVTIADAPSAEGFTFSGWSVNRLATMPAEDVVIYGSWYSNRQDVSGYFAPEITTAVKDKKDFEQGDTIEIEVYVKNTAEFTITNVRIDEGLDGATFLPGEGYELLDDSFAEIASIAPGETVTLKLQYKVTENKDAEYTQIAELVGAIASVPNYELDPNGDYIAQDNFATKKKLTPASVIDDITEMINPVTADNLKHALWLLPFCAATITLVVYRATHKKRGTNRRAKLVLSATLAVTGVFGVYQFGNAVFAEPSEAVDSIALESQDGYSQASPGSWQINKSARWTGNGTAEIKLQLDTRTKPDTTGKDVIFVMDSGSNGAEEEFRLMTSAVSSVAVSMRTDGNNRTALILDSQPYQIISDFSDSQTSSKIHNLDFNPVMINFYQGLEGVENMLRDYTLRDGRELIVVLVSARRPDREREYQASQYRLLKRLYPYITIHTIAFGDDPKTTPSMANITDRHFEATAENLKEQVLAATVSTRTYSELIVEDSIADDFELDENVGVEAALGNAEIAGNGNSRKIVWDLSGAVRAGLDNPQLTIGVKLKEGASRNYYATNNYLSVDSKILGVENESRATTESPVLKANYRVHYDANAPSQCTAENIPADEYYHPYSIVAISEQRPTCEGYRFAGYVPVEGNFTRLNDDYIRILESDVTIRALWLRNSMEKHMDGEVHMINTLYNAVAKQSMSLAKAGHKYNTDENNNFTNATNMSEEETNLGANTMASTVNDEFPVHYFHGDVQSNSVLFAGFCWRIVRTTETGGVKLLYNGLYEDEKKCEVNRGIPFEHNGYWTVAKHTRTLMDFGTSMYYYAPSYQYSLYSATTGRMTTTTRLSLTGGLVAARMNTAGASLEGMYTCKNYKNPSECEEMYYIDEYVSGGKAYVYKMTWHKIRYTNIGATKSAYDNSPDSMSAAFYMQGDDEFPYKQMPGQKQDLLTTSQFIVENSPRLNTTYWYADSVEYNPESGTYSLVDPYQVSSADEYSQLVGKYTFSNISSAYTNSEVYYLYYRPDDANYADAISLTGGKTGDDIDDHLTVGDGVIENSDGTFTLTNPQHITMRDWLSGGYVDYEKKILCRGSSEICDTPHYIDSARRTNYTAMYAGTKFAIAKDMHDYVLEDPLILYTAELFGPKHNYYEDGYKYICIGAESPCQSEHIRLANSFFNAGANPSTYHDIRFAESVEWDGEKYQLKNTVGLEYLFDDEMRSTHRYTCLDARTSCEEVYLYYALKRSIVLHGGVTTLSQARDIMMGDTKDSLMKIMVDEWFEENLLDDLDKIEDTVYCGDRTAALLNSWGTDEEYQYNGGNDFDYYNSYIRLGINRAPSLDCSKKDSYTVSSEIGNGKLTYPVALLSADELVLAGQRIPRGSFISPMPHYAKYTATMSPYQLNTARYYYADDVTQYSPQNEAGISPAISLRPDTLVVGGDGSGSNPYVLAWPDD